MHKYVVMAHAEGPADLAAEVTRLVLQHNGDVITVVVAPDPNSENPFDFIGVYDIDHVATEDFSDLDASVKALPARDPIQTVRQTH